MARVSLAALGFVMGVAAGGAALAQEGGASPDMQRALAAGYKATFLCSGHFNSGRPRGNIERNELSLIYPDYREAMGLIGDGVIDEDAMSVSVTWSETLPPRIAVWREGLGCSQLPIGADASFAETLPRADDWPERDLAGDDDVRLSPDASGKVAIESREGLMAAVEAAFDGKTFGEGSRTSAILVVQNGQIIAERYDRGIHAETSQRTWSVAKSVSATVIGAAVQEGILKTDEKADLTAWDAPGDPRHDIELRHLLAMASGLDSGRSGSRTDRLYFGGGRVVDHAATKVVETAPGTRFKYANNDTLLAMRMLRERMDDDAAYHKFPYESALWKIGAYRTILETDWNGDFLSSSQVWATARDLARIGLLYLQDGVWGGARILPEGWAEYVSAPAAAQPVSNRGWGYGAQFWLLGGVDGLPEGVYAAAGHRGQYILIVPSHNVVIIRRGFDESGGTGFTVARFGAEVLKALKAP